MKILYISHGGNIDYQNDLLFHGLVELGHDVVDANYLWYLTEDIKEYDQPEQLYGKGMTLGGLLPSREWVDRTNIKEKILDHYFDLVIYGQPYRCTQYLDEVLEAYDRREIVFVDGDDTQAIERSFVKKGIYFKRELLVPDDVYPISFAIPEQKIVKEVDFSKKVRFESNITPSDTRTYVYDNEADYYNDYRVSWFGHTMRKNGWDCLRHYEIVANGCMPVFSHYHECPKLTMVSWPSQLQADVNQLYRETRLYRLLENPIYEDALYRYCDKMEALTLEFVDYARKNLTTKNLADYVLSKVF